jgi:WD40 repeat protein
MRNLCLALLLTVAGTATAQDAEQSALPEKIMPTIDPGMHPFPIRRVFFRDNGRQIVTTGDDHTIRIWDRDGETTPKVIHPPGYGGLQYVAISRDGNRIAFGAQYPKNGKDIAIIGVVSMPDGKIVRVMESPEPEKPVTTLAFAPDGNTLATAGLYHPAGHEITLWDLRSDRPPQKIARKYLYPRGLAFSPDGKRLAWATRIRGEVLELESKTVVGSLQGTDSRMAWSADEQEGGPAGPRDRLLRLPWGQEEEGLLSADP